MPSTDDAEDDVFARFREITAGLGPEVFGDVPVDRRRPGPGTVQVLTVRVEIHHSDPSIWRRFELRSDLSHEGVHTMHQTAFGWMNYHLWRFSAGGDAFDESAQQFLCDLDIEETEDDDLPGTPAATVRLGELLQAEGDSLEYLYDYGDCWNLGIVVQAVREAEGGDAPSRATSGERAVPPEDCGGRRDEGDLRNLLADQAFFDVQEPDRELWAGPQEPDKE